jgi:pimeloyl-ACP methyl ester carboxylesterase
LPALFIPGWGARASLYRPVVPAGWEVLELPSFRASRGRIDAYSTWLADELGARRGPFVLGGHSFGAALAVIAAARGDADVERLLLVDPAGLPLSKPMGMCLRDFGRQLATGVYPVVPAVQSVASTFAAPRCALRLARAVYALDLREELAGLRARGVPSTVLAAGSDTLTPPEHCRSVARLAGGDYQELDLTGGHVWFLVAASQLRGRLAL